MHSSKSCVLEIIILIPFITLYIVGNNTKTSFPSKKRVNCIHLSIFSFYNPERWIASEIATTLQLNKFSTKWYWWWPNNKEFVFIYSSIKSVYYSHFRRKTDDSSHLDYCKETWQYIWIIIQSEWRNRRNWMDQVR